MTRANGAPDVVLIGAGIMSATLGTVLKELEPTLDVVMFETLDDRRRAPAGECLSIAGLPGPGDRAARLTPAGRPPGRRRRICHHG
jgi:Malate:quinone oxidoreductase (Mqo)